jgi:hypothetical protein
MTVLIATDYRLYAGGIGLDAAMRLARLREGAKMAAACGFACHHTRVSVALNSIVMRGLDPRI